MGMVSATISDSGHSSPQSSSKAALASQPSLPSLPSLTSSLLPATPSLPAHHSLLATLAAHSSPVFSLVIAGSSLYSGSSDGDIRVWPDFAAPSPSSCLVAHAAGAVKSLIVSGDKLIAAHQDHKIRVWKVAGDGNAGHKLVATLPTLRDRLLRLLPPKNHVQVRRHHSQTWVHHVDAVSGLAVSADGAVIYSVSWDRTLKAWRASDHACLESVAAAHDDAVNAVTVSRDGHVYTGSADTKIKVWFKPKGEKKHSLVATLAEHKSAINALALSSDGSVLYSGACDRSVVVWERTDGGGHMAAAGALRGHGKAILSLAAAGEGVVCSGSADKTVRVWSRGPGRRYSCLVVLEGHKAPVKCLQVLVRCHGHNLHDTSSSSSSSSSSSISSGTSTSLAASCSSCCYQIVSGGLDCEIRVWEVLVQPLEG